MSRRVMPHYYLRINGDTTASSDTLSPIMTALHFQKSDLSEQEDADERKVLQVIKRNKHGAFLTIHRVLMPIT